jgi:hypothetical protein
MLQAALSKEEIARRGEQIYEQQIRSQVESDFDGKVIAIDVETGEYEIDDYSFPAADRLRARCPDALVYAKRIGYDAVYALGGTLAKAKT